VAVIPRGAGSGLSGGAIGDGLIVEFSRYNRQISDLDLEKRTVRCGAGVVLDQLNVFLKPHGFCFGPDVATSSRATIGGMIATTLPERACRFTARPQITSSRSRWCSPTAASKTSAVITIR
jgi:FAD/FMN-containing dehydrogenase